MKVPGSQSFREQTKFHGLPRSELSRGTKKLIYILICNEPFFTFLSPYRFDLCFRVVVLMNLFTIIIETAQKTSPRNWIIVSMAVCWYNSGKPAHSVNERMGRLCLNTADWRSLRVWLITASHHIGANRTTSNHIGPCLTMSAKDRS